jgi:hypothetical protein
MHRACYESHATPEKNWAGYISFFLVAESAIWEELIIVLFENCGINGNYLGDERLN